MTDPTETITIATCETFPGLTPSDTLLASALRHYGVAVGAAPWNGDFSPFATSAMTLIRSTWDYFDVPDAFRAWIDRLEHQATVLNAPDTLRWNMGKTYLFDLAARGAPLLASRRTQPASDAIAAAMDDLSLSEAIVKPLIGGTASGLSKVDRADRASLEAAALKLNGEAMVQPFLAEITSLGETSMIFFDGVFSHSVLKTPKNGDIRVQEQHGGSTRLTHPPAWAIGQAQAILALCPGNPAYARVDVVVFDDHLVLMEVELVEPELFLVHAPEAAERFAQIIIDRLNNH